MGIKTKGAQEIQIFTDAKRLCDQILISTKNAPKLYRWSIVNRLITTSLDVVEMIYFINEMRDHPLRDKRKHDIDSKLKYLGYLITVAEKMTVLNGKQVENMSRLILETRRALWGWINASPSSAK